MNDAMSPLGTVQANRDGSYTLVFERQLKHSPERVWEAITDPAQARDWFMAGSIEPRDGGSVRFEFGDQGARGEVLTWEPPHRLEHTWLWDDETPTTVRWELVADGDGTLLRLTHEGLTRTMMTDYGAGWHDFLDRLPSFLDGEALPDGAYERLVERYAAMA